MSQPGLLVGLLVLLAALAGAGLWMLRRFLAQQAHALTALSEALLRLEPFYARFQETAEQFHEAALLMAEPGYLQEGAAALQGALQPLDAVQASLEEHFAVSDQLLETTGAILEQAAGQRARVEAASERIADLLAQWTADEHARRQADEANLMRLYREAGAQSERMAEGLLEVRTEVAQLVHALSAMERIAEGLDALAGQQRDLVEAQQQAARHLSLLHEEAAGRERQMQQWQDQVLAHHRQAGAALADHLDRVPDPGEQRRQSLLLGLVALLLLALVLATWLR